MDPDDNIAMQGTMMKKKSKSLIGSKWDMRYFILYQDGKLIYYREKPERVFDGRNQKSEVLFDNVGECALDVVKASDLAGKADAVANSFYITGKGSKGTEQRTLLVTNGPKDFRRWILAFRRMDLEMLHGVGSDIKESKKNRSKKSEAGVVKVVESNKEVKEGVESIKVDENVDSNDVEEVDEPEKNIEVEPIKDEEHAEADEVIKAKKVEMLARLQIPANGSGEVNAGATAALSISPDKTVTIVSPQSVRFAADHEDIILGLKKDTNEEETNSVSSSGDDDSKVETSQYEESRVGVTITPDQPQTESGDTPKRNNLSANASSFFGEAGAEVAKHTPLPLSISRDPSKVGQRKESNAQKVAVGTPTQNFSKSIDDRRREDLQAIMRDKSLSRDERKHKMQEVKNRYALLEEKESSSNTSSRREARAKMFAALDADLSSGRRSPDSDSSDATPVNKNTQLKKNEPRVDLSANAALLEQKQSSSYTSSRREARAKMFAALDADLSSGRRSPDSDSSDATPVNKNTQLKKNEPRVDLSANAQATKKAEELEAIRKSQGGKSMIQQRISAYNSNETIKAGSQTKVDTKKLSISVDPTRFALTTNGVYAGFTETKKSIRHEYAGRRF